MTKEKKDDGEEVKKGIYRHYKGGEYKVIGEAAHTEDESGLIVYQPVGGNKLWVRPKDVFLSEVEVEGKKQPRFQMVAEDDGSDYEDRYKRALADYQNLLKQTAAEKQEFARYAESNLLQDILPAYDNLKLSLRDLPESESGSAWVQGVKYVLKQFQDALSVHGVAEIRTVGEKFDHNTMEALEGQGNKVTREIMPGYTLNGRLLRAAKVAVGE